MKNNRLILSLIALLLMFAFAGSEVSLMLFDDDIKESVEKRDAEEKLKEKEETRAEKEWTITFDSTGRPPSSVPIPKVLQDGHYSDVHHGLNSLFHQKAKSPLFILYHNLKIDC